MENVTIHQFTEAHALTVSSNNRPELGPLVTISQFSGCMHFQFSMTPQQAMKLAAALADRKSVV